MFKIIDLQNEANFCLEESVEGVREFLLGLWMNDDELEEDDPFFEKIATANFDELTELLICCDYFAEQIHAC